MRSGGISGSKKDTGTRQALGWPFLSTTKTSPSRATRSRTSPGELRSSIIFKVLKSTFKIRPSVLDLRAGPGAVVAPDFVFVEPLRRAPNDEGEVVRAGIPHCGMQVADVTGLIAMRRVGDDRRCVDVDPRHFVGVGVGKFDREDVLVPGRGLQRGARIDLAVSRRTQLDQR